MTSTLETRDLAAEVADASVRTEQLRREQLRVEAQAHAAQEEYERLLARLSAVFGVSSLEAARELLAELDRQVIEELDIVRSKLVEANGV